MAKKLAVVTILGLFAFTAKAAPRPTNLNANQAQAVVTQVFDHVRDRNEVSGVELSKRFSSALRQSGFATKTVYLTKGHASTGIKIRGPGPDYLQEAPLNYHVVTIVRLIGGWRVVDPVVLRDARLEPFKIWQHRIESPVEMSVK